MPFAPERYPAPGRIHAVTVGTGHRAMVLGGHTCLPFYTFDDPRGNAPKVGIEISDDAHLWTGSRLTGFYAGCRTMTQQAVRAQELSGADFLCLRFPSADPAGANRPITDCVADAKAVAEEVSLPLVLMGCGHTQKDTRLLTALAEALAGKNAILMSAKNDNYRELAAAALKYGHSLCAETADDINLAKQLNIMLRSLSVPEDAMVMNIGTAAVGYGYEYMASTLDRIRDAALYQNDGDLQMPVIAPVCADTWSVKESTATEADEPAWGDREERGIHMEVSTAAADLACGADAVILRHPDSVAAVKRFLRELM